MNEPLSRHLASRCAQIDRALQRWLPAARVKPTTLHQAMRYSIFAGGKRMRPILCLEAAEICGGDAETALSAACAVECIHTYSLIHDDLPCMDDDDLRRGRPTAHVKFGEALALLAGDALLTLAFEIVANTQIKIFDSPDSLDFPDSPEKGILTAAFDNNRENRIRQQDARRYSGADFVRELAIAAGSRRLIAGQVNDLAAEGRSLRGSQLRDIHLGKTAAMIAVSLRLGAMSAHATPSKCDALARFGEKLGLAFQVVDDILDVTQTTEQLGKSAGKDTRDAKSTYPAALGLDGARAEAAKLTTAAMRELSPFGKRAARLREIADYLLARKR